MLITRREYEEAKLSGNMEMINAYTEQLLKMMKSAVDDFKDVRYSDNYGIYIDKNENFICMAETIEVMED